MVMDSELTHSIVGSYLKPPERVFVPSFTRNDELSQNHHSMTFEVTAPKMLHSPNSQALILALKTLQEKIHRLELERTQAEDNLNILSREAAQYKKALENETNERNLVHQDLIKQKKDISIQLSSAQSRCILLEKQLEYTKRMVVNVEREKNMILEQQVFQGTREIDSKMYMEMQISNSQTILKKNKAQLQREKEQDHMKLQAKLEMLYVLEKECFKLAATQKTAEDKIKYLEEKLKEEEHQRKLFQDKASELQTGLEVNRILMSSISNPKRFKEKKKSSKKTKCLKRGPPQHIYSKFGSVPMVTEKSASASMQNLLLMMQHYRPHSLQKPAEVIEPSSLYKPLRTTSQCKAMPPDSEYPVSIGDNLSELLMAMQDELDQMSVEHQELLNQMKETESHSVCEDIECELEHLVKKMEMKGEQISKLMKHQDSVRKLQQKVQNSKMSEASDVEREDSSPQQSKNRKNSPRKSLLNNSVQKNSSFHPIQVHNLQMKLRRDDILWEQ